MSSGIGQRASEIRGFSFITQRSNQNWTLVPSPIFQATPERTSVQTFPIDYHKWEPFLQGNSVGRTDKSTPYLVDKTWGHRLEGDKRIPQPTFMRKDLFIPSRLLKPKPPLILGWQILFQLTILSFWEVTAPLHMKRLHAWSIFSFIPAGRSVDCIA